MSGTRDYLSFRVDAEEYAIPIEHVQEIRAFTVITPIPTAPAYVRGVMNLRGAVSPVVGLREKFGLETKPVDRFSVVLVVNVGGKAIGILVDAVAEVMAIDEATVEPVPDFGWRVDTSFITGMVRSGERYVILLEVEKIVGEAPSVGAPVAA